MLYDTHAHLNLEAFKEKREEIIADALEQGVWLNNVGTQKDTSVAAIDIAERYAEGVYAVVGFHPADAIAQDAEKFDYDFYYRLAQNPKVVGIGECGLDYYRLPEGINAADALAIEAPIFEAQLKLALETDKVLVIHCRASAGTNDAYHDIIAILRKQERLPRFEVHSFTSNWEICKEFLDLGAFIALNGIITFDKTGVLDLVIENLPIDKILLETDAPFLAPKPFRGKQNLPQYIRYTAEYLAAKKGISLDEVNRIIFENARNLFKIV